MKATKWLAIAVSLGMLAVVGCGDKDPASSAPGAKGATPAAKLTISSNKVAGTCERPGCLPGHGTLLPTPEPGPGMKFENAVLKTAYSFNEGSGAVAHDSGGELDGQINGATYSQDTPSGKSGDFSLFFDGSALVEMGSSDNFAYPSISVELFVKPTQLREGAAPLAGGFPALICALAIGQGSSSGGIYLGIDATGAKGQTGDNSNASHFALYSADPLLVANQWVHLALTFDGETNTGRLFVNGTEVASVEQNPIVYSSSPARIGAMSDRTANNWMGFIDEVKIYEGVLTAGEVAEIAGAKR